MNEAKISIILPTYNVEKYIARALNSCINQTLKDIEIIVVDDCGSDNSIKIAKEFADTRIKIIKNPRNLGLLHARASGVRAASAKYIMFLDPDDELSQNACEVALKHIGNKELLRFSFELIGFNDDFYLNLAHSKEELTQSLDKLQYFDFLMWDMIISKELYLKVFSTIKKSSLGRTNQFEDVIFSFVLNHYENDFIRLDDKLYFYHNNNCGMSKKCDDELVCKALDFF